MLSGVSLIVVGSLTPSDDFGDFFDFDDASDSSDATRSDFHAVGVNVISSDVIMVGNWPNCFDSVECNDFGVE